MSYGAGPGAAGRLSSSPVMPLRPSPPFLPSSLGTGGAPSSLGDRRSLASNEGIGLSPTVGESAGPVRKRYSSTFSHRYKDSGASAVSSAGASDGSGSMGPSGSPQSRRGSHGAQAQAGSSTGIGAVQRDRRDSEKKEAVS